MIILLAFIFSLGCLTSCGIHDSDGHVARDNMLKLVSLIENNENKKIEALFSINRKKNIENLDLQIEELCDYYIRTYESIIYNRLGTSASYEYGEVIMYFEMFYDVTTTTNSYHFSILWYIEDDYDENNIGIWSLYIESFIDDTPQISIDSWVDGITIVR